ncbi:hypothetical protein Sme01_03910 [Sphaerisporangium melleum]|uniref:Uncharacterized protein n=1 Tax=Sphaerisporangium melleum TaxID=321316 RepID=A0A917QP56_9ACTN|nr:hypothetical protein [Sphaerisporangium melleum]GGK62005.1 hypothetical protein GCM10007964_01460 [Sphaerisporangium melleum]GII67915.1 hypothetical protein Sme01_03910 [Sphaerisporangium melleum]
MTLLAAVLALAGAGLALTHDVLLAQDAEPSPERWTPMDLFLQAGGLAVLLLAAFLKLRERPVEETPVEHEHALIWALYTAPLDQNREETR